MAYGVAQRTDEIGRAKAASAPIALSGVPVDLVDGCAWMTLGNVAGITASLGLGQGCRALL
jgi:hypothetical protein